ncbi:hypothetical protein RJ640_030503 [Escallonia rubra]|uniref:Uncharacterized protein n=1 Tax=Escallonia rubra TaxID=112253 RepID=A0AA88QFY9_9ASTE|nr:hypothetical protein RJ640_030503 [Escallonia rubra]
MNNASANKGTVDAQSRDGNKVVVEAVDYRSSAGQGQEQRPVEVIHEPHSATPDVARIGGGILASAAASVSATLRSAKEVLSKK